jgi:catechol 2,3-dioxygenase-like lactoylglutathione lyase family enzyme
MGLPNGVHHLAIATRDVKGQIEFFTTVVGMELVALYWMHGVPDTMHAFLRLGDACSLAFVQGPQMQRIEPRPGVSHAGSPAGPVAPGAMQHVALNVSSETDLLALRDRIRSHGYWIMGPVDHGMCKSMYLAAPEGIVLEFATSTGPIDADRWIDPEVVRKCGIDAGELARYRQPEAFVSRNGQVAQPDHRTRPTLEFPPEADSILTMSDEAIAEMLDFPLPPVTKP